MSHPREAIRKNLVAAVTGLSTTGAKVYESRVYPMAAENLPGLCVYAASEQVTMRTMGQPRTQERVLSVQVEIYVRGVTGYDDQVDQILREVEAAITVDISRGGLAQDTQLTGIQTQWNGDGQNPVCVAALTVEIRYMMKEGGA